MNLSPALKEAYTKEHLSARDAQRLAEFIAWGPIVFQTSRLMIKFGILDTLHWNSTPGSGNGPFQTLQDRLVPAYQSHHACQH